MRRRMTKTGSLWHNPPTMITQPETYPHDYPCVRARSFLMAAGIALIVLTFAPNVRGQESGLKSDAATLDLFQQGSDALKAGHYDKAEAAFRKANKLQHDSCFACWMGIAQAEGNTADREGAWKAAEKALNAAGDDSERAQAHDMRGLIKLAGVQTQANSTKVSQQVAGGHMELKLNPSQLDKISKKALAEAEQEYRTAVQLDGDAPGHHAGLARVLFLESRDDEAKREAQAYLELAPDGQESKWIRAALEDPRRARKYFAPDFEVITLSGDVVSLKSLAGKLVVLDFWATWCLPCRDAVGELKSLTRKYPKDSVVLLSVSADLGPQEWREFIAQRKMDWPQYWDQDQKMRQLFDVRGYPTYIVIGRDGVIRDRIVGFDGKQSIVARLKQSLETLTLEKGS
jgi:thiol-disulfide isomerase/thioredoxin